MTPLEVKTCGESEFDVLEEKQRFPDSGKAYYVKKAYYLLKRKIAKMQFLPKNDPFWGKNVRGKKKHRF
jgi:hypothetical protein